MLSAVLMAAWVHDLNPFLLRFSDTFGVRWYGLAYALGFVWAWWVLWRLAKRGVVRIPPERIGDAMMLLVAGVVVGGRLGYVLFYDLPLLWDFQAGFPWWGVLALNMGGMASHGGMIGVVLAAWWIARGFLIQRHDGVVERVGAAPVEHIFDAVALVAPMGLLLGRLANFINGELLGKIVALPGAAAPWWAVKYPQELLSKPMSEGGHAPPLSVEQKIELARVLGPYVRPTDQTYEEPLGRMLRALQSGPKETSRRLAEELGPLLAARHPSQLYQAVAEGVVLGLVLTAVWWKPRRPGTVGAMFLMVYGVLRVATEFWRLPDAHLAVQRVLGLSRGQWLSVAMVAVGAGWMIAVAVRKRERMGGLASAR